jgi:hypothetical protein
MEGRGEGLREILVKNGWLTPIKMRRYDANKWQITRKLIVHPDVAQT